MTRTHKANDREHTAIAPGVTQGGHQETPLPRYFAKHGHVDSEPNKVKKDGHGKANWGREGDELEDYDYKLTNPRRRSNSMTAHNMKDFKTKFETIEAEPVFEEELHGPRLEDHVDLEKMSTSDSSNTEGSVQEEDSAHKKA
ncbi:hypothetical protein SLS58_007550 [Diplodia intermedia]|uniref:Stf2-like protein n=1 Tax=Diplodia intermedia TaxID=856260 RepID=A0ABR3TJS8_9PEZI